MPRPLTARDALIQLKARQVTAIAPVKDVSAPNPLLQRLKARAEAAPRREEPDLVEAHRIKALPEWDPDAFDIDYTERFRVPGGTWRLSRLQNAAIYWATEIHGLLGVLPVGSGKTLVSLLIPLAMKAKRPLLLLPPTMVDPFHRERDKSARHFRVPDNLQVLAYSRLSSPLSSKLLEDDIRPDLIIADEAHCLRDPSAARTLRFLRFIAAKPQTKLVALSGTMTSKALQDYAHLAGASLKGGSPVPRRASELIAWAACLDADGMPRSQDWELFAQFCDLRKLPWDQRKERAQVAFQQRFSSTPGVITSKEASVQCSLYFRRLPLAVPESVASALNDLRMTWQRPDGEELETALDFARVAQQLASGFFLYWDWKDGVVDEEWLGKRAAWQKLVRSIIQQNIAGMDSPKLVFDACLKGIIKDSYTIKVFEAWCGVRDRPKPPTATTWVDKYMVDAAEEWLDKNPRGLVWQRDNAIETEFRLRGRLVYGAGEIPDDDGRGKVLSMTAHGTGLNLQTEHHENLVMSFSGSASRMEQLVGRTHRQGQTNPDGVRVDYFAQTEETMAAVRRCRDRARYIESTMASPQKVLYGTWATEPEDDQEGLI